MDARQHFLLAEERLKDIAYQADHVFAYRLAAEAQAHFLGAIAATLLGGDRELLTPTPDAPPPASARLPL